MGDHDAHVVRTVLGPEVRLGMQKPTPPRVARRDFLRASVSGALAPWGLNIGMVATRAAAQATQQAQAAGSDDCRALVCVYLDGGNDQDNSFVPIDPASYGRYATIRGAGSQPIALARDALQRTLLTPDLLLPGGRQYALHPSLQGLAGPFNRGRAAALLNDGPLVVPLTRQQYRSGDKRYPVPAKLFSHNDQKSTFQSGGPEGRTHGYGGAMGDLFHSANATPLLTSISLAGGNAVFRFGDEVVPYQMTAEGAVPVGPAVVERGPAPSELAALIQGSRTHVSENAYNQVMRFSIATQSVVSSALGTFQPPSGTSPLGNALRMVVQVASARAALGTHRRVFYVCLGSFDTHGGQLAVHARQLRELSEAVVEFDAAASAAGLSDRLTLFTAPDFGRTLISNGDGTDHGWGGHHFIVGAAVKGAQFYGLALPVSVGNTEHADDQWHVGNGRLLPTTSVGSTWPRWHFGSACRCSACRRWWPTSRTSVRSVVVPTTRLTSGSCVRETQRRLRRPVFSVTGARIHTPLLLRLSAGNATHTLPALNAHPPVSGGPNCLYGPGPKAQLGSKRQVADADSPTTTAPHFAMRGRRTDVTWGG